MFFTQFFINPNRRGAQRLLASPQRLHAAILGSFTPDQFAENSPGRILWRLDRGPKHIVELLVISPHRPDFSALVEEAGWPTTESWNTADYRSFLSGIDPGQIWKFRVTANPTKALSATAGTRGQRVAHVTAEQQRRWLLDRADYLGVDFLPIPGDEVAVQVTKREALTFGRNDPAAAGGRRKTVSISRVQFDGLLRVREPKELRGVLINGIGPGKAYGCGLLTLAPAQANV